MAGPVLAAGGVLWRQSGDGIEVAVVHRPRYDDWSLPKGKLEPGESQLQGALREVWEETGFDAVVGRTLGRSTYRVLQDGVERDKVVRWWAMRARSGRFVGGPEVDELRWLAPASAEGLLTAGRDVSPLRLLVAAGLHTTTVLLVRHGSAGNRSAWPGADLDRPLDGRGGRQAEGLARSLMAYGPARVLSAPALRCVDTVRPLAQACGLAVEVEPALGEQGWAEQPATAISRLRSIGAASNVADSCTVACTQGGALPGLLRALAAGTAVDIGAAPARKGSVWALSFLDGALVDAEYMPPA